MTIIACILHRTFQVLDLHKRDIERVTEVEFSACTLAQSGLSQSGKLMPALVFEVAITLDNRDTLKTPTMRMEITQL